MDIVHRVWNGVKRVAGKNPRLLGMLRHLGWWVAGWRYGRMAARIPTEPRTVLFECYMGRSYACSPKAIYEAMLDDHRFDGYELVWAFDESFDVSAEPRLARARIVAEESDEYLRTLARAGTLVVNEMLPPYVELKPDQTYVQTWHGTPLKRMGAEVEVDAGDAMSTKEETVERFVIDGAKLSCLISPSAFSTEHLAACFGMSAERRDACVWELGYPRNDALVAAQQSSDVVRAARERLGIPTDRKCLLYAPTWREDQYEDGVGYVYHNPLDFRVLREALGQDWCVLLRMHQKVVGRVDFAGVEDFVFDLSRVSDINDVYLVSDALVTDYSSVMFDYANLRRPLVLFVPDREHYERDLRGFTFDLGEIPAPLCETSEEVAAAVGDLAAYWSAYSDSYEAFVARFCPLDDGQAARRVIERLFGA